MYTKIGIIGYGNMGSVIAQRIKGAYAVSLFEKDKAKLAGLKDMRIAKDIPELLLGTQVVLLAVKPQDLDGVLHLLKGRLAGKLLLSIAAGVSTHYIQKRLGEVKVIRLMPNIGALIGDSVTCLCKGDFASEDDLNFAAELFYSLGSTRIIPEGLMNAATAVTGSGPGFFFHFVEVNFLEPADIPEHTRHDLMKRLEKAAEGVGFSREDAAFLAASVVNVSIELLQKTGLSPAELKAKVASKGGTTEAGLSVLMKNDSWDEAVQAAVKRAGELSKKE